MHQSQSNFMTYDLGTTSNMVFDEVFSDWPSTIITDIHASSSSKKKKCISHSDSPPISHEQQQQADTMPNLAPLSPCFSDDSSSSTPVAAVPITGQYSNIEYHYHVDPKVLGTGHHGSVRECFHRTTGRRYAVKSIRKNAPDMKCVGLTREITLLREMRKHRGFVRLVDVHEDEDYVHIVTSLCEGGELFDRIMKKASSNGNNNSGSPCFAEAEAARIMHQLLDAVAHMHDNDVAHRDIKPENILFETDEDDSPIRIIDFGLSRRHYDCEPPMNNVVGTPYYIAPEVLQRRYTKSCDLWSVGVIAYILLCGYPPFNGEDNNAVYDAVRRGRYHFPAAEWSGTSREARHFIRCLLQKDPRKRMSALQALNHPWIVKHMSNRNKNKSTTTTTMMMGSNEDHRHDYSSVEVVYDVGERDSVIMIAADS